MKSLYCDCHNSINCTTGKLDKCNGCKFADFKTWQKESEDKCYLCDKDGSKFESIEQLK